MTNPHQTPRAQTQMPHLAPGSIRITPETLHAGSRGIWKDTRTKPLAA